MPALERLRVIGTLESCFREKFGTPRQPFLVPGSTARLRLAKDLIPEHSLDGLEEFSHVWLLSYLHLNANKTYRPKIHPPRLQGKTVGLFASRSPHRPSALGLTLARLSRVEGDTVYFSGIDLVDGTPILDIKPYIQEYDRAPGAKAGWVGRVKPRLFVVRFSRAAREDLAGLKRGAAELKSLIGDVLRHDLRNPRDGSQMRPGKELEVFLLDKMVSFSITGRTARVGRIRKALPHAKSRGRA